MCENRQVKFKAREIGQREIALRQQSQSATLNPSILVTSLPIFNCRMVSLKGSDFDTKKSLLDAVRWGFPGSVSFALGVKNEQIGMACSGIGWWASTTQQRE